MRVFFFSTETSGMKTGNLKEPSRSPDDLRVLLRALKPLQIWRTQNLATKQWLYAAAAFFYVAFVYTDKRCFASEEHENKQEHVFKKISDVRTKQTLTRYQHWHCGRNHGIPENQEKNTSVWNKEPVSDCIQRDDTGFRRRLLCCLSRFCFSEITFKVLYPFSIPSYRYTFARHGNNLHPGISLSRLSVCVHVSIAVLVKVGGVCK